MLVSYALVAALLSATRCQPRNDRPIIGVLAQEEYGEERQYGESYIAASYVKYLESAGARVVPIKVNQTQTYYENLLNSINGVLFPGGGVNLSTSGYGKAGRLIFDFAVRSNLVGDYFPLWGTCLGFELLNFLPVNRSWMVPCWVQDVALPLIINKDYEKSRLFGNMSANIKRILMTQTVTVNYHRWCLTDSSYSKSDLGKFYRILTYSNHSNMVFISTVEAYKYPFYGVAWHPEKNQFEFTNAAHHRNIPHTAEAILVSQYFANFFVNEARKSQHHFNNPVNESKALIYNYQAVYTGAKGSSFEQKYFFGKSSGQSVQI